jgi:hypothetical protein
MAGLRLWAFGFAVTLLIAASAPAFNDYSPWGPPYMVSSYVLSRPILYGPIYEAPRSACACMPEPQILYACPTPAPASSGPSTHEPPLGTKPGPNKGPTILQNRVFSGVPQFTEPRRPLCKVTFWNLIGYDVRLTVGDRVQDIAKDRAVTLEVNREFEWRAGLQAPKTEVIADDLNYFDVLIK